MGLSPNPSTSATSWPRSKDSWPSLGRSGRLGLFAYPGSGADPVVHPEDLQGLLACALEPVASLGRHQQPVAWVQDCVDAVALAIERRLAAQHEPVSVLEPVEVKAVVHSGLEDLDGADDVVRLA